jgi:dienelactone hydrolase
METGPKRRNSGIVSGRNYSCFFRFRSPRCRFSRMSTADRREELYSLLGDLPDRHRPISARKNSEESRDGYILERLTLDLNGIEEVPGYFVRPATGTRFPCILYNHSHGGNYALGKDELLQSRSYMQPTPYAIDLTRAGYAVLAIDHWCFGGRNHTSELDTFKLMLWRGQVLWGMMTYDSLRALDYLLSRPDVDPSRVATLGMSMGSTMAWWLAALDDRIKVCIDLYCLTDFDALIESKSLHRHGIYYYVPALLKYFTTTQINALIAPRPHLSIIGTEDALTPIKGVDRIERELAQIYSQLEAPNNFVLKRCPVPHTETESARKEFLAFLATHV